MTSAIRATKLYLPKQPAKKVFRTRLIERLNEGLDRELTLVAAPAGFGKTTLVSEWLSRCGRPVAWLSLDEAENDSARFLTYLVAALQMVVPEAGEGAPSLLGASQPPPTESVLTVLLNEIVASQVSPVLVLDDYHVIDSEPVDRILSFLLDHLPHQLNLVIATREDPRLPLSRLRARGQLSELRAVDLRFTVTEAEEFLTEVMGLDLSGDDAARLEARTEGWIAGLQLAALSLRGQEDVGRFIDSFTGSHRYVLDYLVEEVLQRQPEQIRTFLLRTCILDRLTGPLCDAVTGQEDGSAMLARLERGNFFVVPLDDHRRWYRYHHLFADVLTAHALAEQGEEHTELHRRASRWYEQQGLLSDAVRHALTAEDFERAAGLVELAIPAMRRSRQGATLLAWLKALPNEIVRCRPVLSVTFAGVLLNEGQLDGVETHLQNAERWLDTAIEPGDQQAATAELVVVDEEALQHLPQSIAMHRAGLAQVTGDASATARHAVRALEIAPEDDHEGRGAALALLGLAAWAGGDLETAHRKYSDGMARLRKAGFVSDAIGGGAVLADVRVAQGRLREAMATYAEALRLADEREVVDVQGTIGLLVGMSELHVEWNDLDAAAQCLVKAKELGRRSGQAQGRYRWFEAMARVVEAQGDREGALGLLDEAERVWARGFAPNVRPIAAVKVRTWLGLGWLDEALAWARKLDLSAADDPEYLREFEHITLARVLIARFKRQRDELYLGEAMGLLERLLHA
ncbi:MAG TPA: AAA family ATPase, partial [Trueperaceae bacterium]|nr:AAA family ATPase [Trueperaceae bacterium]